MDEGVRVLLHAEQLARSGSAMRCSSAKRSRAYCARPDASLEAASCAA
jgi:hypothetical protein